MKTTTAFFLFFALFLTGCSEKSNRTENKTLITNPGTVTKIRWLAQWYGEGKKETLIREIAREFSLLHQDIEIELVFPYELAHVKPGTNTFPNVLDSIVKMVEVDEWPFDLMLCDYSLYEWVGKSLKDPEWGKDLLVNFRNEPWYMNTHKQGFFNSDLYTMLYGGMAPGAYIEGVWNVIYASSEAEKKLGIEVKPYDMTFSDFMSYARTVYQYNLTHKEKITFFANPNSNLDSFFSQIVMSALNKEKPENREEAINALKEAYKALEQLSQYKPFEQYARHNSDHHLIHDRVLFNLSPSWINMFWQRSNPAGEAVMHPCEIPSIDNKKAYSYSGTYNCVFVIPQKAKNRKEAEELMRFIASGETADKWIKYSKNPTGLRNQMSYNEFGTDKYTAFNQHISRKYQDRLNTVNLSGVFFQVDYSLEFYVERVLHGELTAEEAMRKLKELKPKKI